MRIINLIENTEGRPGFDFEHGLSFYIETENHKLLLDLGQTDKALSNATKIGIDLTKVDTMILSHGHYDHSGGIMAFSKINPAAEIYMQKSAAGEQYADDGELSINGKEAYDGESEDNVKSVDGGESPNNKKAASNIAKAKDTDERTHARYRYIGIDKKILKLPQLKTIEGDLVIDDEIELFTIKKRSYKLPFTNKRLLIKTENGFFPDTFCHEHFLVIKKNGSRILISGCAHNGILSILDAYKEKYASFPDVVISGFHLMVKREYRENELREVRDIAEKLNVLPVKYFTCHCTGLAAYEEMKKIMGEKLDYVHSGQEIYI